MFPRARIHLPAAAAALAAAGSLAACGGSSPPRTNHTTGAGRPGALAYRFSDCMRSHGVSNFPDPQIHQDGQHVSVMIHLTSSIVSSPAFKSAQQTCSKYLGNGPQGQELSAAALQRQTQAGLAFSRCMRGRGFANFPDPTAHGQLTPEMVTAAGINLHQPAVLHAGLACTSVTHGLLTRADIERAVNGGGGG